MLIGLESCACALFSLDWLTGWRLQNSIGRGFRSGKGKKATAAKVRHTRTSACKNSEKFPNHASLRQCFNDGERVKNGTETPALSSLGTFSLIHIAFKTYFATHLVTTTSLLFGDFWGVKRKGAMFIWSPQKSCQSIDDSMEPKARTWYVMLLSLCPRFWRRT